MSKGPERMIVFISVDRRHEYLECGHVLVDMPHHPTSKHPVKYRRCLDCKEEQAIVLFWE